MAQAIPEGLRTVTLSLCVSPCDQAITFYEKAFGAKTLMRHVMQGRVGHAEIKIGDSVIFLSDEFPGQGPCRSPKSLNGTTAGAFLYVDNVDAWFDKAVKAGGTVVMPVADMFWGDRFGQLTDPFGHVWSIATHKEDLTPQQMEERQQAFFAKAGAK